MSQIIIGVAIGVIVLVIGVFISPPLLRFRDTLFLRLPKKQPKTELKWGPREPPAEKPKEITVEVIKGILYRGYGTYNPGDRLEISTGEAEGLIKGGFIKQV